MQCKPQKRQGQVGYVFCVGLVPVLQGNDTCSSCATDNMVRGGAWLWLACVQRSSGSCGCVHLPNDVPCYALSPVCRTVANSSGI